MNHKKVPITGRELNRIYWALDCKIDHQKELYREKEEKVFKDNIEELKAIFDKVKKCLGHYKSTTWNFGKTKRNDYLQLDIGLDPHTKEIMTYGDEKEKIDVVIEKDLVIPSLKWLFEEARTEEGYKDLFLCSIVNKALNMKVYEKDREDQESFMKEVTECMIKHHREVKKTLGKAPIPPVLRVEKLSDL